MPEEHQRPAAPYLPWKTFLHSLEVFTEGIPPRISRGVWRQSGLVQGQIMGAYRFLGLIDENDKPTAVLDLLRDLDSSDRPAAMKDVIAASYPDIMLHDLKTMTFDILNELIEKYNVSGSTKKKAITFFLQAAKYAGLPLSTFIQVRSTGQRRRRIPRNDDGTENDAAATTRSGSEKVVELNSGGKVTLRVSVDFLSLTDIDRKFVFELVDRMSNYYVDQSRKTRRAEAAAS